MRLNINILLITISIVSVQSAKILAWFPFPSISHQVVFRPVTQELAKRGHEVVVITTDPAFPPGQAPPNLTEIDIHDISYGLWREVIANNELKTGKSSDPVSIMESFVRMFSLIVEKQMLSEKVQNILKNEANSFDLLMIEVTSRPIYSLSAIMNVPVILFSSLSALSISYDAMGAPTRPTLLYPTTTRYKINNLSIMDKLFELYNDYITNKSFFITKDRDIETVKKALGSNVEVDFLELLKNVDLLFLNVNQIWDQNRPVPPGIVYLGGLHQQPVKDLPQVLYFLKSKPCTYLLTLSRKCSYSPTHITSKADLINMFDLS